MKISLPLGIALVMMGTHGYGLFLFGAILPTLQARHGFDYPAWPRPRSILPT